MKRIRAPFRRGRITIKAGGLALFDLRISDDAASRLARYLRNVEARAIPGETLRGDDVADAILAALIHTYGATE